MHAATIKECTGESDYKISEGGSTISPLPFGENQRKHNNYRQARNHPQSPASEQTSCLKKLTILKKREL